MLKSWFNVIVLELQNLEMAKRIMKIRDLEIPTPYYVVDENLLIKNLEILKGIQDKTGCKIILAAKAFSMYSTFKLIGEYLAGTTSSSLHEAKLCYEEMGKEAHIFSPAYHENDFDQIMHYCDNIVFNSFGQWKKYREKIKAHEKYHKRGIECGLRINPEYSEISVNIYDPCRKYSRLGITSAHFEENELDGITGLHFHALMQNNSDVLWRVLKAVEEKFGKYLHKMKWINFGGGHYITDKNYDIKTLIKCITHMQEKYDLKVYLEPGEAVGQNAGFLVSSVLDITENEMQLAIMDASASCHMPEVIEGPYTPNIVDAENAHILPYTYELGGQTCLAGDIMGNYSFHQPLKIGQRLVFTDMAIYTMVRNNTFNGINLPSIVLHTKEGETKVIKSFNYEDFKRRL